MKFWLSPIPNVGVDHIFDGLLTACKNPSLGPILAPMHYFYRFKSSPLKMFPNHR